VLLSIFCSVLGQLSAGINWEGSWSNGKRGGGSFYLCTDEATQTAHGSYGSLGIVSGYLLGSTYTGFWYESGYDRPFGPFILTISDSGTSFTGAWSYFTAEGAPPNGTFTWSGSKSSSARPDDYAQCLFPISLGSSANGAFEQNSYICDHSTFDWLDSNEQMFAAKFDNFGKVQGYSPDGGVSLLLSDFHYNDDEDTDKGRWRPESFPIGKPYFSLEPDFNGADDDDSIFTLRIVVGRFVEQDYFCGFFWYGFYSHLVAPNPICFGRLDNVAIDPQACAYSLSEIKENDHKYDDGVTTLLEAEIQDALFNITLPEFHIKIVKGNGTGVPENTKDVQAVNYVQDEEYIIVCTNNASTLLLSVLALFALLFAI